jgi:hypothetical protein
MNYTAAVFGGVLLLSVLWYYFPKWGGKYWFEGPIRNVEVEVEDGEVGNGGNEVVGGEGNSKKGGNVEVREVDS